MDLPDEFPDNIDYSRYELEAAKILDELGFYGTAFHPSSASRIYLTRANMSTVLGLWMIAA